MEENLIEVTCQRVRAWEEKQRLNLLPYGGAERGRLLARAMGIIYGKTAAQRLEEWLANDRLPDFYRDNPSLLKQDVQHLMGLLRAFDASEGDS